MESSLRRFEGMARRAHRFAQADARTTAPTHPFDARNIAAAFPSIVRELFDDGHYAQATFEAYKFLDKEVQRHSKASESGFKLMMQVLGSDNPTIRLTPMLSVSQKDEQKGYQFLFAGSMLAIRNPRGHEPGLGDDPDLCLDHLGFASMLLRRLAEAGFK